jgi:hypothetical protein
VSGSNPLLGGIPGFDTADTSNPLLSGGLGNGAALLGYPQTADGSATIDPATGKTWASEAGVNTTPAASNTGTTAAPTNNIPWYEDQNNPLSNLTNYLGISKVPTNNASSDVVSSAAQSVMTDQSGFIGNLFLEGVIVVTGMIFLALGLHMLTTGTATPLASARRLSRIARL